MYGTVVETTFLTPTYARVVLGGDGLADFEPAPFTDQYVNALFVPDGAPYGVPFDPDEARQQAPEHRPRGRRYTIRWWDAAARRLAIDFVVHGDVGYAGRWAARARPGDRLQIVGPSGGYAPAADADWHLLVGDESALPAIAASLDAVPAGRPCVAVVVVDDADHRLPLTSPGDLDVTWVHRADDPDGGGLLRAVEQLAFPPGRADVFVHGEAAEVRSVRRHLLGGRGIAKDDAGSISPYWRRGHTDEAWREVKSAWLAESALDV
jgi:NADPH-dependent ferric siderophore reductase